VDQAKRETDGWGCREIARTRLDVRDDLDARLVEDSDHALEVGVSLLVHGEDITVPVLLAGRVARRQL
jgi:hypothetical protein